MLLISSFWTKDKQEYKKPHKENFKDPPPTGKELQEIQQRECKEMGSAIEMVNGSAICKSCLKPSKTGMVNLRIYVVYYVVTYIHDNIMDNEYHL